MKNFKVGDRVTAIKKHERNDSIVGKKGTIITLEEDFITVEFDSDIKGNKGVRGNGKERHCWNFWGEEGRSCLKKIMAKKIVITSDDDSTIRACLYEGKKNIASGIAKCHPKDEFDFTTGAKLAFERLLVQCTKERAFDWEDFKKGKFGVSFTTDKKLNEFLFLCQKKGIYWYSGARPLEPKYTLRDITYNIVCVDGCLMHNDPAISTYSWDEFESPKVAQVGDYVILTNPNMCYNTYVDWVKTNAPEFIGYYAYNALPRPEEGEKFQVVAVAKAPIENKDDELYLVQDKNNACFLMGASAIALKNRKENFMKSFKVGDRVMAIHKYGGNSEIVDKTGTIISLGNKYATIEFEEYVDGHNGNGCGTYGFCWTIPNNSDFLKPAYEEKIVITSNGNVVEACLYKNERILRGYAKCSPKDNFDFLTGAKLALQRLEETEKVIEPGDKVKIVESGYIFPTRPDWIKENAPGFLENYCYNVNPNDLYANLEKERFTVVAKGEPIHNEQNYLLLIQDNCDRCFIIDKEGVELVEN